MKLLVIDPNVVSGSPSMRAWLDAFPTFCDLFEEVEVWACHCALDGHPKVRWVKFSERFPVWTLHALDFQWQVRRRMKKSPPRADTLVQVTGSYSETADIRYVHFWNSAFREEIAKRPETLSIGRLKRAALDWNCRNEQGIASDAEATRWWWVVSQSIAERIALEAKGGEFRILPNQYDPARFCHETRVEWREMMREHYGFEQDEHVLVFSAFGQFERKGLAQAVEAISLLRKRGFRIRLLVLGGNTATLESFRKNLKAKGICDEGCLFAGLVERIERHLSAADGLFFPSHFEAFSLAEIEAAALGLRLYLTKHYGIEMILNDPVNGRLLPWDFQGMADVIQDDLEGGRLGRTHHDTGRALTPEMYRQSLRGLYLEAIQAKCEE